MTNKVRERYEQIPVNRVVTVSNIISILRAALALPIVYFLIESQELIAFILIIIAIVSDMLDGWLARISNDITELGKMLDPLADKIVIFSIMLYLIFTDVMPVEFFGFLLLRDLTISLLGIYMLNNRNVSPKSNKMGKVSVIFTTATTLVYLYSEKFPGIQQVQIPLVYISIVFLSISWIQYCYSYIGFFQRKISGIKSKDKYDRLAKGLSKTETSLAAKLPLFGKFFTVDETILDDIEAALLSADIGVDLTEELIKKLKLVKKSESTRLNDILKDELKTLIKPKQHEVQNVKPRVILMVGVNGTGKTTSIGKLSSLFTKQGKNVLIAAADTFRAAAYDQLKIWSVRSGVEFLGNPQGKDPAAVAFDAARSAVAKNKDVLIIDTAGRLHTKSNLMQELAKMKKVIKKVIPEAPHDVWLVLDSTIGQNSILQAQEFTKSVGVTGLILTKLDGTAKGGVVLAIHKKLNIPIYYLGVGEQLDDMVEFDSEKFINALLDEHTKLGFQK